MTQESYKAMRRRNLTYMPYFSGNGLDVGAGADKIFKFKSKFHKMHHVRIWDMPDGDGELLATIEDNSLDFVHSSHSLEHMKDWSIALKNWLRVVRPGGYVIVCVPEWRMYEHGMWPSRYNSDHKWAFTLDLTEEDRPFLVKLTKEKLESFGCSVKVLQKIDEGYDFTKFYIDQTADLYGPECSIEFVLQKNA